MNRLAIRTSGRQVGTLIHDPTRNLFDFVYDRDWLRSEDSFPLSPQMPMASDTTAVEDAPFEALAPETRSAIARAFFQNLLPEGQALDVAAQANGLSKANLAGLLLALGAETAGALSVTLADASTAPTNARTALRALPFGELSERIRARSQTPFSVWDGKVRLSIAGLQDKIAVFEDNGELFLADGGGFASTVILKPAPQNPRFGDLPVVEHVCMHLAAAVGIPTARTRLLHVPEPVLLVERFDRRRSADGLVQRLHIIDACQGLGLTPELKYERAYGDQEAVKHLRDGASLRQLFSLSAASASPLSMRMQLVDRLIFNVLIGNTDAHGKNWSFFIERRAGLLSLAPAYDLVDVEAVADEYMSTSFAMGIGDAFHLEELGAFQWASMAVECGLTPRQLATRIRALSTRLPKAFNDSRSTLEEQGVTPALLDAMAARLAHRCQRLAKHASLIPQVSPEDLM
ncbi:HipA domain-containing protein [Roseateles chitinivorans]|uniref:HipA domain-containing protein n=1 Tax=Roseateles chitinivorans TaxID=2917965 RepID=UPI003D671DB3